VAGALPASRRPQTSRRTVGMSANPTGRGLLALWRDRHSGIVSLSVAVSQVSPVPRSRRE
jgi:hypothetical protein